jgi:hypothetical protein
VRQGIVGYFHAECLDYRCTGSCSTDIAGKLDSSALFA